MLKLLKTFGLLTILGIVPLYSSEESPWGGVMVWPGNEHQWMEDYKEQLAAKAVDMSWNRPNCMPGCEPESARWVFWMQDSLVTFMQERDLNLCPIIGPPLWRDSTEWGEYWQYQVERYDGDGEGYGGIQEMSGLTKPVKYWNISNEPDGTWMTSWNVGDVEYFRSYVRISSGAIHNADPTAKVVAPSMGMPKVWWW
ncbi:MAG: hypothetical protein U9R01_00380 [candidate division WOR-3 bacterium]|nr:hypothetical protein [candidate division WOR-3 bacterium]